MEQNYVTVTVLPIMCWCAVEKLLTHSLTHSLARTVTRSVWRRSSSSSVALHGCRLFGDGVQMSVVESMYIGVTGLRRSRQLCRLVRRVDTVRRLRQTVSNVYVCNLSFLSKIVWAVSWQKVIFRPRPVAKITLMVILAQRGQLQPHRLHRSSFLYFVSNTCLTSHMT